MIEKIEKIFGRRKVVFYVRDGVLIKAYGQTAGGWGRVDQPLKLASKYLSNDELSKIKQ